jgi:divalent metal cation (Fe/Co/Zn/Cd) transporter
VGETLPLPSSTPQDRNKKIAFNASWAVNWLLLAAKIYVFYVSKSKSVLASLADSAGGLLMCQSVVSLCVLCDARYQ